MTSIQRETQGAGKANTPVLNHISSNCDCDTLSSPVDTAPLSNIATPQAQLTSNTNDDDPQSRSPFPGLPVIPIGNGSPRHSSRSAKTQVLSQLDSSLLSTSPRQGYAVSSRANNAGTTSMRGHNVNSRPSSIQLYEDDLADLDNLLIELKLVHQLLKADSLKLLHIRQALEVAKGSRGGTEIATRHEMLPNESKDLEDTEVGWKGEGISKNFKSLNATLEDGLERMDIDMKELRNAKELSKKRAEKLDAQVADLSRLLDKERKAYEELFEDNGDSCDGRRPND